MSIVKKFKGHDVPEDAQYFREDCKSYHPLFIKNEDGYQYRIAIPVSRHKWRLDANEYDNLIELPQEPEAFVPVVGECCESLNSCLAHPEWQEVYICGKTRAGDFVFEDNCGYVDSSITASTKFRPIKTEREKFMGKVAEAICGATVAQLDEKSNAKRIAGIIFDAGLANV
ncbi:MAG: hypothetical protein JKY50_22635 [Oleispira sp.]|nr:hypothetical protein [Oleispira sp.]